MRRPRGSKQFSTVLAGYDSDLIVISSCRDDHIEAISYLQSWLVMMVIWLLFLAGEATTLKQPVIYSAGKLYGDLAAISS